jgi:tetratricopeptide (TPR) repeat protein
VQGDHASRSELGLARALTILGVLVFGAFAPALSAGFVILDDPQNFLTNPGFRGFSAEHLHWMFGTGHMGNWQPLSWLSYALDHAWFGLDGPRFHQVSVLWHFCAAVVFFFVAEELFARVPALCTPNDDSSSLRRGAALFSALVFAVHPLRAESVAWVTGRNDVVAGLFFLLALLAWLRYTRLEATPASASTPRLLACVGFAAVAPFAVLHALVLPEQGLLSLAPGALPWLTVAGVSFLTSVLLAPGRLRLDARVPYVLACLAAALSLLGKAYGMVLPLLLLLLDAWPLGRFQTLRSREGSGPAAVRLVVEKLPLFALSFVCARLTLWAKSMGHLPSLGEHSLAERLGSAAFGLFFYVRKTMLPTGLSAMVDLPASIALTEPRFLFSLLAVLALTLLLFRFRARAPAALAVWVSYAIGIGPSLGIVQSGAQLVADRYSYVACMPLALGAGGLCALLSTQGPTMRRGAAYAAGAFVLALTWGTWHAAARWADPVALFEDGIAATQSPRLMTNLAMTYNEAASQDPVRRLALLERALEWSERAVSTAESRQLLVPEYRLHRGTIFYNLGRSEDAVRDLEWFVARVPSNIEGHLNLGLALLRTDNPSRAVPAFERCTQLAPDLEAGWRSLGAASEAAGDVAGARASYQRALELAPDNRAVEARLRQLGSR